MSKKLSKAVVTTIAELYDLAQIDELLSIAVASVVQELPRVEMTGASFDLGSASGIFVKGDPEYIVRLLQAAKKILKNKEKGIIDNRNKSMIHGDFSQRRAGW